MALAPGAGLLWPAPPRGSGRAARPDPSPPAHHPDTPDGPILNGILPFILVFVMLLARDERLIGDLRSGWRLSAIGWTVTAVLIAMSLVLVWVGLFSSST